MVASRRVQVIGGMVLGAVLIGASSRVAAAPESAQSTPTWVSTAGTTVSLTLIASWNNVNAGFNFNGAAHGQMVVTVPLGDKINVSFKNNATTPHDVVVIPYAKTLPGSGVAPAFAGAASPIPQFRPPAGGTRPAPKPNAAQSFSFVASKAGTFMIMCGISGHTLAGMWDTLVVSPTAKTASVAFGAAPVTAATGSDSVSGNTPSWVSTKGKVASLTLIAGWNKDNAGFNFNGAAHGHMIVTVPLGDKVVVTFKNNVPVPHDVLVVPFSTTPPARSVTPAFPGARSPMQQFRPGAGRPAPSAGAAQTFSFVANKAGTYMIICGVPGHALAGMWDTFVVSPTATSASIAMK